MERREGLTSRRDELIADYWSSQPRFAFVKNVAPHASLLDFGAGRGGLVDWLGWQHPIRSDVSAYAIDIVDDAAFARYADYDVVDVAGRPSRFADTAFDAAICAFVLERVDNVRAVLRELARLVRPAGRVYFEFTNKSAMTFPRSDVFAALGFSCEALNFFEDCDNKTCFDIATLTNELAIAGFAIAASGVARNDRLAPELLTYGVRNADCELTTYALRLLYGLSTYVIADRAAF